MQPNENILSRKRERRQQISQQLGLVLDSTILDNPNLKEQMLNIAVFYSGTDSLLDYCEAIGEKLSLRHIQNFWPDDLLIQVEEELTLEDQLMLIGLMRHTIEGYVERTQGEEKIAELPIHFAPDTMHKPNTRIHQFIEKNWNRFTTEDIARMACVDPKIVDDDVRVAALFSCLDTAHLDTALPIIGIKEPVLLLENFRGYVSCPATEELYSQEKAQDNTGTLEIISPKGRIIIEFKYTTITIGICTESTDPDFEVAMSYVPIGQTLKLANDLQGGKRQTINCSTSEQKVILAKNRMVDIKL